MTSTQVIKDAIAQLRNTLGDLIAVDDSDPNHRVSLLAASGRLVVAPGQTIASAWGNTTYDQTQNVFASAADRDAQWPAPKDGARCYTLDKGYEWVYRSGQWRDPAGQWIQAWTASFTTSSGGIITGNYPNGPFASTPVVHVQNGDLSVGAWDGWATYQAGMSASTFGGAPYSHSGNTIPSSALLLVVVAIGPRP